MFKCPDLSTLFAPEGEGTARAARDGCVFLNYGGPAV